MMTLPDLTVLRPATVAEAVEALRANPGARLLAGGTDIVPNLKYGMYDTRHLVALRGLSRELRYVREELHRLGHAAGSQHVHGRKRHHATRSVFFGRASRSRRS